MSSPFSIFRKHEKVLMVILTGLAMLAFSLNLDQMTTTQVTGLLAVLGGAGLFWALGSQRGGGRGIPYAIAGGVLGLLLALVVPRFVGRADVVETSYGGLTGQELGELMRRRSIANAFFAQLAPGVSEGAFGPVSDEAVAQQWVWH